MIELGQLMTEIQRDAAELPTGQLRKEIQVSLDVLAETIDTFHRIRPSAVSDEEMTTAIENMMCAALVVSLNVRELTTRPISRYARVYLSRN
jgi:predicted nucleic acid-binding protein